MTATMEATVVAESDLVTVTDIPGSVLYQAEAILPGGGVKVLQTRAYTRDILVHPDGKVEISIGAKARNISPHTIRYPYHFLWDGVLCAVKFNKMKVVSSFALNYHLFCEKWDTCLMFHVDEKAAVFVSGRDEWEQMGVVESFGQEVNISLEVDVARHVPVEIISPILGPKFMNWLDDSKALAVSRGK